MFAVELETGCWLAAGDGDPSRTLVKESAKQFHSAYGATLGLARARRFRPFEDGHVVNLALAPQPTRAEVDLGFDSESDALQDALARAEYWKRESESRKRAADTVTAENAALSLLLHEHGIKSIEPGHPYAALLKLSKEPTRAEELLMRLCDALELPGSSVHSMNRGDLLITHEAHKSARAYLRERGLL